MAKAKKKEALTQEERLQAALVPDWEQPYKLPENWCWVNLENILQHRSGNSKLIKGKLSSKKRDGFYDAYSAAGQDVYMDSYEHEGTAIIISAVGARCGKAFLATGKWSAIANTHIIYSNSAMIDIYFLYYVLNDESWWIKSGSAQPFVVVNESLSRPFALPPIGEQQRIVDRVKSLFAKLDEVKEKAQAALNSVEPRKAAILRKAFTGELTAQWRKECGVGMESWEKIYFEETFEKMQNGLTKRSGDTGIPFAVLRLANLSDTGILTDGLRTILLDEKEQTNFCLNRNDVLMIRVNGSKENVGKQFLVENEKQWAFCDHIIRIKYKEKILPSYMVYFSKTNDYKLYVKDNMVSSAGQNTISRKGMSTLQVPVPEVNEQTEIVRILDDLLTKEQQVKEIAEAVLGQIDLIKRSILSHAICGKLGTNDPTEESAVELVKRALEKGNETVSKPKTRTKRVVIPAEMRSKISNANEEEIIRVLMKSAPGAVSTQTIMSISKKKFELMDALRSLEKKQLVIRTDAGEYLLTR